MQAEGMQHHSKCKHCKQQDSICKKEASPHAISFKIETPTQHISIQDEEKQLKNKMQCKKNEIYKRYYMVEIDSNSMQLTVNSDLNYSD
jgi:hypothetical protein